VVAVTGLTVMFPDVTLSMPGIDVTLDTNESVRVSELSKPLAVALASAVYERVICPETATDDEPVSAR
jgi:hypothetical protein